jgi:hypothetical protein
MRSMQDRFSDFWLSDRTKDKLEEGEELSAIELAQAKRSIADFVRIMTRQNIPVKYQEEGSDRSYTDGDVVTIAPEVDKEGNGFDATVGVALHEASHIVKSDFDLLEQFNEDDSDLVPQDIIDKIEPLLKKSDKWQELKEMLEDEGIDDHGLDEGLDPEEQAKRALHHIWNVVEDRWIDQWAYSEAPGYRGYYQKMYAKYWHSEEVGEALAYDEKRLEIQKRLENGEDPSTIISEEKGNCPEQFQDIYEEAEEELSTFGSNDEVREFLLEKIGIQKTWSEYSYRVTNITNENVNFDALPGLREIWNILNVSNIERHGSSWDVLETAKDIMRVILENADELYVDPAFGPGGGGEDGEGIPYEDLPDELQEELSDQLDQMQGEAGEELDEETADKVDTLEDAGVDTEQVGQGVGGNSSGTDARSNINSATAAGTPCVVIESISDGMITTQSDFPIIRSSKDRGSNRAVQKGIQKGRILGNRLKIRDERRNTKYRRKRTGKLDSRMLAEIGHSSNLFYTEEIEEYKNGFIHISVDASGSMSGNKFEEAMQTCVAIAQAARMIENIRAQVSFRSTVSVGSDDRPLIVLAYDSKRDTMATIKKYFPHLTASGTTPEGLCFEAIQDKVLPSNQNRESYFVNLSDGKPNFSNRRGEENFGYGGDEALEHTAREVRKMKRKGVQVLSYYIGGNRRDRDFKRMYGSDSRFIDVNDINGIQKTLNEKFLEEDGKKVSA